MPPFEPHPWLRGGHAQTVAGRYLPGNRRGLRAVYHEVDAGDGDRLTLLDSVPSTWSAGDPVALLVHGLGGCARAGYVARLARRLYRASWRVVRMNLRGVGSGFGLARGIYHAGRTEDVRRVAGWAITRAPGSCLSLVGFSLGANLVLKLAAEAIDAPLPGLESVVAANPPLDLLACCRHLQRPENRLYDRNFVNGLKRQVARLHACFPDLPPVDLARVTSLYEFDDVYTAPRNGFSGAEEYYARSSAGPLLSRIRAAGLVVHAEDDPFIPAETVRSAEFPPQVRCEMVSHGGHLGYISRRSWAGDHRWLDARLTAWLVSRGRVRRVDSRRLPYPAEAGLISSPSLEGDETPHVQQPQYQ